MFMKIYFATKRMFFFFSFFSNPLEKWSFLTLAIHQWIKSTILKFEIWFLYFEMLISKLRMVLLWTRLWSYYFVIIFIFKHINIIYRSRDVLYAFFYLFFYLEMFYMRRVLLWMRQWPCYFVTVLSPHRAWG